VGPTAHLDGMEKGKILSLVGNRTPAVQPVARRYTDSTILDNSVALVRKQTIPTERPPLSAK
jgi:hypothetical protein